LAVVRPAGHEEIVTDFLTVEMEIGHAEGGPVQGGPADRRRKKKGFPEKRGRLAAMGFPLAIPDPLST